MSQIFLNYMAAAPSKWISNRQLNSLTALAKPIYQHAHGPRTVRHLGSRIKGAIYAGVLVGTVSVRSLSY